MTWLVIDSVTGELHSECIDKPSALPMEFTLLEMDSRGDRDWDAATRSWIPRVYPRKTRISTKIMNLVNEVVPLPPARRAELRPLIRKLLHDNQIERQDREP